MVKLRSSPWTKPEVVRFPVFCVSTSPPWTHASAEMCGSPTRCIVENHTGGRPRHPGFYRCSHWEVVVVSGWIGAAGDEISAKTSTGIRAIVVVVVVLAVEGRLKGPAIATLWGLWAASFGGGEEYPRDTGYPPYMSALRVALTDRHRVDRLLLGYYLSTRSRAHALTRSRTRCFGRDLPQILV